MYCTKCGAEIKKGDGFCGKCGAPAFDPKVSEQSKVKKDVNLPKADVDRKNSITFNMGKKLYWIIGAAALLVIAIICIVVFPKSGSKEVGQENGEDKYSAGSESAGSQSFEAAVELTRNDFINSYNRKIRSTVSASTPRIASDDEFIASAKTLIDKMLKNPSTAQYNSAEVVEKDSYGRAIVHVDVSAQNSFGGWVRSDYYVCIKGVNSDGQFTFNPTFYYIDEYSSVLYESLKSINDFDENPADEEVKDILADDDSFSECGSIDLGDLFLSIYNAKIAETECYLCVDRNGYVRSAYTVSSLNTDNSRKVACAMSAAMSGNSYSEEKSEIENVINLNSNTITGLGHYYNGGLVYDCKKETGSSVLAVTLVEKDTYETGLYWTPNTQDEYCEKLGDKYFEEQNYDEAIQFYQYSDSAGDKLLEAYYKKAEDALNREDFETAATYYSQTNGYKDSVEKMKECYYKAGCKSQEAQNYLEAISLFESALNYSDAPEKVKENNYLQGKSLFDVSKYTEAAPYFENSGDYSDASTMELDCFYLYGKQQMELGYVSDAIEYLSKCRGFKDADDILLSYYYDEATKAYNTYMTAFADGDSYTINLNYEETHNKLVLCEGYKDSNSLLCVVDKLYEAKKYYGDLSSNVYGVFSMNGATVTIDGNIMTINVPSYTNDAQVICSLNVQYNMSNNSFTAIAENMYGGESVVSKKNVKMVESLLNIFGGVNNTSDFVNKYSDKSNWDINGAEGGYSTSYGGRNISVHVTLANSRLRWTISCN